MTDEQKAPPQFVGGNSRAKTVPLEWPVEYDGRTFDAVNVARLTVAEVTAFQESLSKLPADATVRWPIYQDVSGAPIPDAVMDALDDDDALELEKAALDFLPRRFRGVPTTASEPKTGEAIEPSSEK